MIKNFRLESMWNLKMVPRSFPLILFFLSLVLKSLAREGNKFAICVTGPLDSWLPKQHLVNLVQNNPDAHFSFFFTFQAQPSPPLHQNNHSMPSRVSTNFAIHYISELYTTDNSAFVELRFVKGYDLNDWKRFFRFTPDDSRKLDRIPTSNNSELEAANVNFLNSFRLQQACLQDIVSYEREVNVNFDYFIFFPSDAFYFHPISLSVPIEMLKHQRTLKQSYSKHVCNVVTKDCLEWGGMGHHFQMMHRKEGIPIYASRLRYYRSLYDAQTLPFNKESFELLHLQSLKLEKCAISVDLIPVTAGVPASTKEGVCLTEVAVQNPFQLLPNDFCVPLVSVKQVRSLLCGNFELKEELLLKKYEHLLQSNDSSNSSELNR